MSDLAWSSALSPQAPSVPHARHWAVGSAFSAACFAGLAIWYSTLDHSRPVLEEVEEERVIVALGGSAPQRIEAPPPPSNAPVSDTPPVAAERAKDAPPIAPPPEPRPVFQWSQGDGQYSSGTGGTAQAPSPPAPPAPLPPPKPAGVSAQFTEVSTVRYARLIVYPPASLRQGEEGLGILAVTIAVDGKVLDWKLVQSTGADRLDAEIRRVAQRVKRLDPLPQGFRGRVAVVRIPINFKIQPED
ncbi:MAG: TonB family protein [Novosphingobium sp.]|nr:TonB family protein [Novosphingobium sp.]